MGNASSTKSLPYSILDCTHTAEARNNSNGWAIHDGKQKSDSSLVTVFKLSKASLISAGVPQQKNGEILLHAALHHFSKIKTLVHPHVLRAYATLDTDDPEGKSMQPNLSTTTGDLIIVTERVTPLLSFLESSMHSQDCLSWGIHNLIHAMHFLHNTAKLSHGRICLESIYVTPGGDFKLGDFSLLSAFPLTDHFRDCDSVVCPAEYRSTERLSRDYDLMTGCSPHVMDSYSLGILIEQLFMHPNCGSKIPPKFIKALARLKTHKVKNRPRIFPLLKCPIFDNALIINLDFLDGIAAKPAEEKIIFFLNIPELLQRNVMDLKTVGRFKILPELIRSVDTIAAKGPTAMTQDVNRREMLSVISPLFIIFEDIAESDDPDDIEFFQKKIVPLITLLFQINDRGVRGALLSRIPLLTEQISKSTLNLSIFEPMCSGFTDSSAPLRELTLKSAISLVPYLTSSSLEKLTRYLIRLQSDPEASIRTNTIIFVGKVIHNLGENQRQKLILPAFTRAMKDEFTPCRLAALKAVFQCREYLKVKNLATDVLPLVCPHLMDGVQEVRDEAFKVVDHFMVLLKEECLEMNKQQEQTNRPNSTDKTSSSGVGGWAMSGLVGSWAGGVMSSSKEPEPETNNLTPPSLQQPTPSTTATTSAMAPSVNEENDGWSDEDANEDFEDMHLPPSQPSWMKGSSRAHVANNDEEAFFSSFEKPAVTSAAKLNAGSTKGKLVVPKLGGTSAKKTLAERRAEFETRKALRQQQLQEKSSKKH